MKIFIELMVVLFLLIGVILHFKGIDNSADVF